MRWSVLFQFGVFEGGATGGSFQAHAHVVADCETFRCSD